jgi:predicted DNA-binding transcriptional regulator YafY
LRKGGYVGKRMEATRGTLVLMRLLAERPMTQQELLDALRDEGLERDHRTLRRWLEVLRQAGFDLRRQDGRYQLRGSPVHLPLTNYEALAALNILESFAAREPVYGRHLASAVSKLRDAIPEESLRFADSGSIEFAVSSASDPPENPEVIDTLRRATRQSRRVEIIYQSLQSETVRRRTVEPVRVAYAQRAHRLYAYEPEAAKINEFRVNRIEEAKTLPHKFSPVAHIRTFEPARIRLSEKDFVAFGKTVIPDDDATIQFLEDGEAIIEGTTPSVFWTVREIASLGPGAEILGSPRLREEFISFLKETINKYE